MASSVFIGWFGGIQYSTSGTTVTFTGSVAATGQFLGADGSASAPSFSFTSDATNGMYLSAADVLSWSTAGVLRLSLSTAAVTSTLPYLAPEGSAAAPAFAFAAASDRGIWNGGAQFPLTFTHGAVNKAAMAAGGNIGWQLASDMPLKWRDNTDIQSGSVDVVLSRGAANVLALDAGDAFNMGVVAGATSAYKLPKKVTGIADNTATDILTVTIPNANHAATIKLTLLTSNGSTDAFESSRTAEGSVVVARTTGANAVATASTLTLTAIATVAAGATHTLAYGVSAIAGAAGASNTFTIQVTIDDSGTTGSNQCVVLYELLNAEATGVTVA